VGWRQLSTWRKFLSDLTHYHRGTPMTFADVSTVFAIDDDADVRASIQSRVSGWVP
jgi:hypothetical protein